MEKLQYSLPVFEGSLQLLLHLIAKHKLNIYDISITELLKQYLAQIDAMREADLDIASEFLEMAARLLYIKTVSLLPRQEEAQALKEQLTGELLEYQAVKEAADRLREEYIGGNLFVREPEVLKPDRTYRRTHHVKELAAAYAAAAGKGKRKIPPPAESFAPIVGRQVVSVGSRIAFVLRKIRGGTGIWFRELLGCSRSKSEMVATFLAVLELLRDKRLRLCERPGMQGDLLTAGEDEG